MSDELNFLIAAGGTGGHLYPALAVVEQIEKITGKKTKFTFVGNPNKIESKVVSAIGYEFHPISMSGLGKLTDIRNIILPYKIFRSYQFCRRLIKKNNIQALIAAGAYLSYPPALAANNLKIPVYLIESNVFPGKVIRLLQNRAKNIFTSYEKSKVYFRPENRNKLKCFGNPVRMSFTGITEKNIAKAKLKLDPDKLVILIFGGSLGARSINNAVLSALEHFGKQNYQILWQTGNSFVPTELPPNIKQMYYIDDMATAYSAADLVVSRSGGTTVAELSVLGKPSVLIPLPYAANNEQESNALELVNTGAAILLRDNELLRNLAGTIDSLINNPFKLQEMSGNSKKIGKPNASFDIASQILENFI